MCFLAPITSPLDTQYMSDLKEKYTKEVVPALKEEFGYANVMQVPKVTKVTVNAGISQSLQDASWRDMVVDTFTKITGQKPVLTKAKKSISSFKVREGMIVGVKTTLRGKLMYDFLEKFVGVALPRVRDFRGLNPKSFDRNGNVTIGLNEHLVFPEIDLDAVTKVHGLEVVVTTTAKTPKEGLALLRAMGFPFKK